MPLPEVAIVLAWAVALGHSAALGVRGVRRDGDVARWACGALVVAGVLVAGAALERRSGGALPAPAAVSAIGIALLAAGAILHVRARRALAGAWSSRTDAPRALVEAGPYGRVRHPIYAAVGLLAMGTVLAHPSLPTIAGALGLVTGLALKTVREERALASAFGPRWDDYRRRVPAVVPRRPRRS